MTKSTEEALDRYAHRTAHRLGEVKAVLFDMDGVLYDSMPGHAKAWSAMCKSAGIDCEENEFFAYEGRTGASTINLLYMRQYGHGADDETCRRLYAIKSENFKAMGLPPMMDGASEAVSVVIEAGIPSVLVTGSGQASILDRLSHDYPGAFDIRITAHDVSRGKPDPEPYLMGMERAGVTARHAVAVDNAPLGVESASRAGAFTIGVRTGPLERGALLAAGADIEVNSMAECADILRQLL